MGRGAHWKKKHERILLQGAGIYGLAWFKAKTGDSYPDDPNAKGRSRVAIYSKSQRLYGLGGLTRGSYTLRKACELTGYATTQLFRAREALCQKWKRTSARGSFLIYEEQLDDLVQWLRQDYWSKKHRLYGCQRCGMDTRLHGGQGLCVRCFNRYTQILYRCQLPKTCSKLLEVLRSIVGACPDMEKQLLRGRALTDKMLEAVQRECDVKK